MSSPKLFKCLPIPQGDYRDVYDLQAIRMVLLHNVMIRGFNSILHYASQVSPSKSPKEFKAFLGYCVLICDYVHHHHANEEDMYFPFLTQHLGSTSMDHNVEGHDTFKPAFAQFESHIGDLKTGTAEYNVDEFRNRIYAFADDLFEHLAEEIDTLRTPRLKSIPKADLDGFEKKMDAHVQKQTVLTLHPMIYWINGDGVHGTWFPPFPAPIAFVCRSILWHKHSEMWGFGSCDKHSKVKAEFAAYEPELEVASSPATEKVTPILDSGVPVAQTTPIMSA